jgi:hypothetical protein
MSSSPLRSAGNPGEALRQRVEKRQLLQIEVEASHEQIAERRDSYVDMEACE